MPSKKVEPASRARALRADGEATYKRILETAGALIAASGFQETTNKAIAKKARVDLASLNYHFGSRGGLYQAVLADAYDRLVSLEGLQHLARAKGPAREKLRRLLEAIVDRATDKKGWQAKVLAREILSPSSHLRALQHREMLPKVRIVLTILSEISGLPEDDPALLRCFVSVAAPCAMLVVGRSMPLVETVSATPHDVLVEHLYSFALAGLEAIGRRHRR